MYRPAAHARNARAPNQNASFPARGKKVWGEEYLNQLTLMQYRSIHSDEMRSATAAAQGAKAPANTSSAPSSSSCACPPSPETALSAAPAPMMRTGTYNGSTSSESSAPAPRNPRVSAAPIAPIRKNSSTVSASELRRTASSRSRWITQRSAAIMSARLEIDAQRRGDSRLEVRREDHRGAPRNVLGDQALHAADRGGVERGKRLIQDPQRHRLAQGEPRKSRSAALPLRQHPRGQILATGKPEPIERLADPRGLRPDTGERARHVQVLGGGQVILDRIGVSHVDEPPPEFLLQPPDIL